MLGSLVITLFQAVLTLALKRASKIVHVYAASAWLSVALPAKVHWMVAGSSVRLLDDSASVVDPTASRSRELRMFLGNIVLVHGDSRVMVLV